MKFETTCNPSPWEKKKRHRHFLTSEKLDFSGPGAPGWTSPAAAPSRRPPATAAAAPERREATKATARDEATEGGEHGEDGGLGGGEYKAGEAWNMGDLRVPIKWASPGKMRCGLARTYYGFILCLAPSK